MFCVVAPFDQLKLTIPLAPFTVRLIAPLRPPLQLTFVTTVERVMLQLTAQFTTTCVVAVHPLASVTVKVYVPAVLAKVPVPVYGVVPPLADTVTVDVPATHADAEDDATSGVGWVIVADVVAVQPLASVTVNVNVPAVLEKVPVPEYGAVPPDALMVTIELPPLHAIFVWVCEATGGVGCVTVALVEAVQLLASVTVSV
jgi:hypothetical protein